MVGRYGERRDAERVLVGKPEGKRPLGRPKRRNEENIKIDLKVVGWGRGLFWSGLGYGQVADPCKWSNEPPVSVKCGKFLD